MHVECGELPSILNSVLNRSVLQSDLRSIQRLFTLSKNTVVAHLDGSMRMFVHG